MKALILCAGKGTRLGLKKTPKCMVKVNGKPILEHLVNSLNKAGITEIVVNIHKDYDKIFNYFGTRLLYFYEPVLMGEAGTERALFQWLGDSYIVMNGDTLTNIDFDIFRIKHLLARTPVTSFIKDGKYAGSSIHTIAGPPFKVSFKEWDGDGAYFYDCGTPKGLRRARRRLKKDG